jgi:hypothetical protein
MGTTPRFGTHFLALDPPARPQPPARDTYSSALPVPVFTNWDRWAVHYASYGDIRQITPISAYRVGGVAGAGSGRRELWN